ncbi:GTP pyrophosphokinase family protein [Lacticaseibacillus baoqingensis]|uniref:GTP pyrophosphokinase family protein n=1 Tax=Lacticaseibacillus baoqingensis TaxID=2486013 RepID=A0ABW4E2Z2_9LACO|nr:GTP pyrophosphokinase family protein [Lacticaseibacillus baoqingensis]
MILERTNLPNLTQIQTDFGQFAPPELRTDLSKFISYYQLCQSAVNEVGTKLENLDSDYQIHNAHNPIHHMEARLKDVRSLLHKLEKKGLPLQFSSVQQNIYDIGGIRVITNYQDDVYTVADNLLAQSDITLLRQKDYIKAPKPSGYRSLHLVVSVPVFQASGVKDAPVEIQIRTVGMDMWASLEHKLRYKTNVPADRVARYAQQLQGYADDLDKIESNMQAIFHDLEDES